MPLTLATGGLAGSRTEIGDPSEAHGCRSAATRYHVVHSFRHLVDVMEYKGPGEC